MFEKNQWEEISPFKNSKKINLSEAISIANSKYLLSEIFNSLHLSFEFCGNEEKTTCPFSSHEDSTPSFYFNREKNIFHCFGCQKSGGVVQFLSFYYDISIIEALKKLVSNYTELQNSLKQNYLSQQEKEKKVVEILKNYTYWLREKIDQKNIEEIEKITWAIDCFLRRTKKLFEINIQELETLIDKVQERISEIYDR